MLTADALVSVVVPVYNGERYVRTTLESALAQSYPNLEVIVVDDGSTDGTPGEIAAVASRDGRLRAFRNKNAGVAAARNLGISHARGSLIAPMDADDLWHPDKIARQVSVLNASDPDVGLVYCWTIHIDENDVIIPSVKDLGAKETYRGCVTSELAVSNFIETSSVPLFKRSCFEKVGGYDAHLEQAEDWKLYLELSEICEFAVVPEYLVGYRQYTTSLSGDVSSMAASQAGVFRWLTEKWPNLPQEVGRERAYRADCYLAMKALNNDRFRQAAYYRARAHISQPKKVLDLSNLGFAARLLIRLTGLRPAALRLGRPTVSFQDFIAAKPSGSAMA
jgi:glycosyltransferase involved in cell wall biosynthesis